MRASLSHSPRAPRAAAVVVSSAAWVASVGAGCSGQTAGPSSSAFASVGDDAGFGGAVPAAGGSAADANASASPPSSVDPTTEVPMGDDGGADAGTAAPPSDDAAADGPPDGACSAPLSSGDLAIDEIMIESVAGAGDDGEWLEVGSQLDCAVNLNGLHGECPRGAKVARFDVTGDVWLPPRGTFLVADSSDPAINHRLPGLVLVWLGHAGDVLRNKGSTITLSVEGGVIDTVTYPALALAVGTSVAFPSGCDPTLRSDFTHWKRSTASWFPGFFGTPNAPNTDVQCP